MIEETVLNFLSENLSVPCFTEVPTGSYDRFLVIEKTGSDSENHMENATIAVQSYAKTLYEAARLNTSVVKVMKKLTACMNIFDCTLNSDYNFTDSSTKKYRYQAVFDIQYQEDQDE